MGLRRSGARLLGYTARDHTDRLDRLSPKCQEALRSIYYLFCQIDDLVAKELRSFRTVLERSAETDPEAALWPEYNFEVLISDAHLARQDFRALNLSNSETFPIKQIVEQLKEPHQYHDLCQATISGLSRIQTRFIKFDGHIDNIQYCRQRAKNFLEPAENAACLFSSGIQELNDFDPYLVFIIQQRLTTLLGFESTYVTLTREEQKHDTMRIRSGLPIQLSNIRHQIEEVKESHVGYAYAHADREWDPTMIAITMIVLVACVVLLAFARQRSSPLAGRPDDSDFFFLIQAAMMQALGIVTVMLPLQRRAAIQAWSWAWAFAILGVLSIIASVTLYNLVPTWWSGLCSFSAAASQAAITLQVMLAVDSTWKQASAKEKRS